MNNPTKIVNFATRNKNKQRRKTFLSYEFVAYTKQSIEQMNKLQTGDTVRFLNSVGGGKVKGFLNKQVVIVEDENGFDVPVLASECVVVASEGNKKLSETETENEQAGQKKSSPDLPRITPEDDEPAETVEGEKITACLAYLPTDVKTLSNTSYECYFVNDSNYYLFFTYLSRENSAWKCRYQGSVEPNTKIFLEEFDKTQLNEIEKICVQFIAFKHHKPFGIKQPYSVELAVDTVKFYKLHSFRENDYFDEDALVYYIARNDVPEHQLLVSATDVQRTIIEKERPAPARPRRQRIEKKEQQAPLVVDLHIDQLLDTTAGMTNADMLEYQLQKFHEAMEAHAAEKNAKIVFIHGKGNGVLKNAILKELQNKYKKCYHQDASFQEYGYGATMVTIK